MCAREGPGIAQLLPIDQTAGINFLSVQMADRYFVFEPGCFIANYFWSDWFLSIYDNLDYEPKFAKPPIITKLNPYASSSESERANVLMLTMHIMLTRLPFHSYLMPQVPPFPLFILSIGYYIQRR